MKQVLQYPGGETRIADVPAPGVAPGTLLVGIEASLVSVGTERMIVDFARKGLLAKARARPDLVRQVVRKVRTEGLLTTMDAVNRRLEQPMPLGYSAAGRVLAVGDQVAGVREGDRVACAGAGHAEVVRVPVNLTAAVPGGVSSEAAAFTTVGAIALHGFRCAECQLSERVVVVGLGLIGLLSVQICRAAGIRVTGIDPDPSRRALAEQLGADLTAPPDLAEATEAVLAWTGGLGADCVLVCASTSSSDPVELAAEIARDRARVVVVGAVGMELPRRPFYMKELDLRVSRSYGPGRYDPSYEDAGVDYPIGYVRWTQARNLASFLELVDSGAVRVDPLITHRIAIADAESAYSMITEGKESALGVVLTYPDAAAPSPRTVPVSAKREATTGSVGLGLMGAGMFATGVLLPAVQAAGGFKPVGVCTSSGLSARHAAERFGFAYATTEAAQVFDDESISLIAIATRHGAHASQTVRALEAGKDVFVEKPLCLNREELSQILRAQAAAGGDPRIMVGFNRRFAPLAESLKAFVDEGGEPALIHYRVNAGPLPPDHWLHDPEAGGGRILGEGCHFIDFACFLGGALPTRVWASGVPDGTRYREDNLHITVEMENGSRAVITYTAAGDRALGKERCEVFCGGGMGILDDFRTLELARGGKVRKQKSRLRQDKGHGAEWARLAESLRSGGASPIALVDLVGSTLATIAAQEALRSAAPVDIDTRAFFADATGGAE